MELDIGALVDVGQVDARSALGGIDIIVTAVSVSTGATISVSTGTAVSVSTGATATATRATFSIGDCISGEVVELH